MDLDTILKILQLGTDHKYLALAIVVIGWLTSLTSDWSKFPITIPGRYQPLIAAVLGISYGVLTKIDSGTVWYKAVFMGLIVGLATGGLYDVVINAIFGGNIPSWLAWLSFAKKSPPAAPPMSGLGKAESLKPAPMGRSDVKTNSRTGFFPRMTAAVVGLALILFGCSIFTPERDVQIAKGACIIANAFLESDQLNVVCNLLTPEEKAYGKALSESTRVTVNAQVKAMHAEACAQDAGPDAQTSTRVDAGGAK